MTDQQPKQKPIETHRDGRVTAAIWANPGERGPIYNTNFSYAYQDKEGNWRDTNSIPGHELLKTGRLAEQAYGSIQRLKDQDRALYVEQQQQATQAAPARSHPRER